ncbi:carbon-nitrogen hydrolase family protein [Phyllobacterium endophyticum]|uniref:carbon-nitrogen hydrolase family protein n=1 Tax=Phyllobacterium endophyticum TaxID=1149773 RepID=UPI0011C8AC98|nr:carbon-nitrogen hydrolase family protein [Phyllobacterium endophyticum]TXR47903.1 carbon-nitrogen hydrolase family protein [Phyllobacterium endophyticum]
MKIAALQMQSATGDVRANLDHIERAAVEAARAGAKLLITPELCVTGYGAGPEIISLAEPPDGDQIKALQAVSSSHHIAIVAGFAERAGADVYNSAAFIDGFKEPAIYRKSHLYGDYEKSLFKPSKPENCIVEVGELKFGLLICYDVEFPENVRRLALGGVDAILVPTALPAGPSGTFIANHMIQVRAFENQIFVAYVNHAGADARFTFAGNSRIAAPDGSLVASSDDTAEHLLFADIEPARFAASIGDNPYLKDVTPL